MKYTFALIACTILLNVSSLYAQEKPVFGYFPAYRNHYIDSIQLDQLTHLIIAFGNPTRDGQLSFEGQKIAPLIAKAKANNVKVLISLGGRTTTEMASVWNYWLNSWNRDHLVLEIMNWVSKFRLDGVDIDLEGDDVNSNYSGFIITLANALHRQGKILSLAVPAKKRSSYLSDQALSKVDYFQVMAYDLRGPWRPSDPGQHAPLFFAEKCIKYWKKEGIPSSKIILGLPLYGWEFSKSGVYPVSYGFMVARDPAFAQLDKVDDIYYNGFETIRAKTGLAKEQAGGVMLWELGQDAFNDLALLNHVYEEMNLSEVMDLADRDTEDQDSVSDLVASTDLLTDADEPYTEPTPGPTVKASNVFLLNSLGRLLIARASSGGDITVSKIPVYPSGLYLLQHLLTNDMMGTVEVEVR